MQTSTVKMTATNSGDFYFLSSGSSSIILLYYTVYSLCVFVVTTIMDMNHSHGSYQYQYNHHFHTLPYMSHIKITILLLYGISIISSVSSSSFLSLFHAFIYLFTCFSPLHTYTFQIHQFLNAPTHKNNRTWRPLFCRCLDQLFGPCPWKKTH